MIHAISDAPKVFNKIQKQNTRRSRGTSSVDHLPRSGIARAYFSEGTTKSLTTGLTNSERTHAYAKVIAQSEGEGGIVRTSMMHITTKPK